MAVLWVLVALCSSASTSFLGVALIDVVKAFAPLLTMLLSMLFERDEQGMPLRYSCKVFASVCVVVVGTIMAVYDLSQSSPLGYFLASVATISMALLAVVTAVLLSGRAGAFDAINLTWFEFLLEFASLGFMFRGLHRAKPCLRQALSKYF
eukprot:CAMPEP_0181190356 /NCGR_PEP_ID=MMETSP1096-20121128/12151_1 /TAXON_ID=156174 ORGANISM="Chrysochromulina ericina, Strain CCMP281" /NCGR_SAMPLE_ID=MMETSP1096 /ASSEMBLY_ACC=CAM_ASM_000453 /LENGTH=150 /DNA_ID=CAMNT_0023279569 /DNA_START=127 /DNA_END=579 /DNA_ORIENTATION=+